MARRKKRKVSYRRSGRRMGAVKSQIMDIVGIAAGAAAGRIVASKLFPNMDEKIKNVAVIALGSFVFPKLVKGGLGANIGTGMVAAGSLGLLQNFNVIGAINDVLEVPVNVGAVEDNISLISGDNSVMAGDIPVLAGAEEEDYVY